jgi:hypothetical protein
MIDFAFDRFDFTSSWLNTYLLHGSHSKLWISSTVVISLFYQIQNEDAVLDQPEDVVNFWYYMVIDKEGYQITEKLVSF